MRVFSWLACNLIRWTFIAPWKLSFRGAASSGEPGIHDHRPGALDSGFSALRASPRNDGACNP